MHDPEDQPMVDAWWKTIDVQPLTPMFQQYIKLREKVKDALLFFRLGDFYELFFDDAVIASRELGLVLTGRDGGGEKRIPMCGIPYHAAESYLKTLIERGYKVAISEQVEDPKTAKGLVKREITRIVTPGMVIEEGLLTEDHHFLLGVSCMWFDQGGPGEGVWQYGLAAIDVSTGDHYLLIEPLKNVLEAVEEILHFRPREIVLPVHAPEALVKEIRYDSDALLTVLEMEEADEHTHGSKEEVDDATLQPVVQAASRLLRQYIERHNPAVLSVLRPAEHYTRAPYMTLDPFTRRNLELFETRYHERREGSLFIHLDHTVTAPGRRLLAQWLERPLTDPYGIEARLQAVEIFARRAAMRLAIVGLLKKSFDLMRLAQRLALGTVRAHDLMRLHQTLLATVHIVDRLTQEEMLPPLLQEIATASVDELIEVRDRLAQALSDDPEEPGRGGTFREGFDDELDHLRHLVASSTTWLESYVQAERDRTGIRSLKYGYNKVFGYYLEVTRANVHLVPDDYMRKQTLANGERYTTEALKTWEEAVSQAASALEEREIQLFEALIHDLKAHTDVLIEWGKRLALLDVLQSLAEVAVLRRYVRPDYAPDGSLYIGGGRHPVVETMLPEGMFVKNDVILDREADMLLITGPNMAGKSTVMRQVALIQILFQMGSFVPADAARLPIVDRIFTRMGAADDLARGESTFMIEMKEINVALQDATRRSLILIDELGRGTSTEDGLAIAQAVIEYIHQRLRTKTLISTHFHELAALEGKLSRLKNMHLAVEEKEHEILFTRRLKSGATSRSYGIYVARLAGLPAEVIKRAETLVKQHAGYRLEDQPTLFASDEKEIDEDNSVPPACVALVEEIAHLNLSEMTPIAALNWLYQAQERLRKGSE